MHTSTLFAGALAAFAAVASAQSKTPINASIWNTMVRYTTFQQASVGYPCPRPPFSSTIVQRFHDALTDRKATLFRDAATAELVLSFPGTNFSSLEDVFSALNVEPVPFLNSQCDGCLVSAGAQLGLSSILAPIKQALNQSLAQHPGDTITLTGHSQGAANAALAYVLLRNAKYPITKVFSFGQPRIGNDKFVAKVDSLSGASTSNVGQYWRITHAHDIVPGLLPKGLLGYMHHATEFWQQNGANNKTSQALTSRCYGDEPADCINSINSTSIPDHLTYTNIYLPGDNTTCA